MGIPTANLGQKPTRWRLSARHYADLRRSIRRSLPPSTDSLPRKRLISKWSSSKISISNRSPTIVTDRRILSGRVLSIKKWRRAASSKWMVSNIADGIEPSRKFKLPIDRQLSMADLPIGVNRSGDAIARGVIRYRTNGNECVHHYARPSRRLRGGIVFFATGSGRLMCPTPDLRVSEGAGDRLLVA